MHDPSRHRAIRRGGYWEEKDELSQGDEVKPVIVVARRTMPANPDVSAIAETVHLEACGSNYMLELGQHLRVTREEVLADHGSLGLYRERLLLQALKRRWFSALTDFHSKYLFAHRPPRYLAHLIQSVLHVVEAKLRAHSEMFGTGPGVNSNEVPLAHSEMCGTASGADSNKAQSGWTLGGLLDAGFIKLVLKGGMSLLLLKLQALKLLPGGVSDGLADMRPKELSDVDFVLMIGGEAAPSWLEEAECFDKVHQRCTELVESALLQWVSDLEVRTSSSSMQAHHGGCDDNFRNFTDLFAEAEGPGSRTLSSELASRLNAANARLRHDLRRALQSEGLSLQDQEQQQQQQSGWKLRRRPQPPPPIDKQFAAAAHDDFERLFRMLDNELHVVERPPDGDLPSVLPTRRSASLRILSKAKNGTVELEYRGSERRLFVSTNFHVSFRDPACLVGEQVSFSLVRVLMPFRVQLPRLSHTEPEVGEDGIFLGMSRAETIDISVPKRLDIHRVKAVKTGQPSFCKPGRIVCEGVTACCVHVESLNSLLWEQRNLTFGPRMHELSIWRVNKSSKRLVRLIEMLGIKAMTSDTFGWREKAEAFFELAKQLANFHSKVLTPTLRAKRCLQIALDASRATAAAKSGAPKRRWSSGVIKSTRASVLPVGSQVRRRHRIKSPPSTLPFAEHPPLKRQRFHLKSSARGALQEPVKTVSCMEEKPLSSCLGEVVPAETPTRLSRHVMRSATASGRLDYSRLSPAVSSGGVARLARPKRLKSFRRLSSRARFPGSQSWDGIWLQLGIGELLMEPLQQLELKMFSEYKCSNLPMDFATRWSNILRPMAERVRTFGTAFQELARLRAQHISEEALYQFEFSSTWGL